MSKPGPALKMTDGQREILESLTRSQTGARRKVVRAKALLMAAGGIVERDNRCQFVDVASNRLGLKPHRLDTFNASGDPKFEDKLIDVVGLYVNPPENAIVLCADEKSSAQALDRTQASLPMTKGRGPMPHDYKRNGT
ncbi:MAG: IS630 family transposase, partial [Mycobacterium sp.]|nr:IS630 family transposase [Mycobacterium sp.]